MPSTDADIPDFGPLSGLRRGVGAAFVAVRGVRPGHRLVGALLAGGLVGLAAVLAAAPWGELDTWVQMGGTGASASLILGGPAVGALIAATVTWIPNRVARSLLVAFGLGSLLLMDVADHGPAGAALSTLVLGLTGVAWTVDAAVSPPWFARGRARALLVVLATTATIAGVTAVRHLPAQLPHDAGPWTLLAVICVSIGTICLIHAAHDAGAARLIARAGATFEERDRPDGAVPAVATPGPRGRFFLGRAPLRQGLGAYRVSETAVPVVQLLAPPKTARRWLVASALALSLMGTSLLGLAALTSAAVVRRAPTPLSRTTIVVPVPESP